MDNFENRSSDSVTANQDTAVTGGQVISNAVLYWTHAVVFVVGGLFCLGGMCSNTINIIVFCRQGILYDSCTTTLLGLSIADFFSLLTCLGTFTLAYLSHELPTDMSWNPKIIMPMVFGRPYAMFSMISCWVTSFMAFERCVCVVFPFKVKTLFSAKRSLAVLGVIFGFLLLTYSIKYTTDAITYGTDPVTNRTVMQLTRRQGWKETQHVLMLFKTALRFSSVLIVLVCTKLTVVKVLYSNQWRKRAGHQTTSGDQVKSSTKQKDGTMSDKELKLVRMITTISIVFLMCYAPNLLIALLRMAMPELQLTSAYNNLFLFSYAISFFTQTVNYCINIFVYFRLSSRYKKEFRRLFHMKEE